MDRSGIRLDAPAIERRRKDNGADQIESIPEMKDVCGAAATRSTKPVLSAGQALLWLL